MTTPGWECRCPECGDELLETRSGMCCPNGHGRVKRRVPKPEPPRKPLPVDQIWRKLEVLTAKLESDGDSPPKIRNKVAGWLKDETTPKSVRDFAAWLYLDRHDRS